MVALNNINKNLIIYLVKRVNTRNFKVKSFLEIPRGPRGINFIFLDPRGM
jgi:hypothetical protein